MAKQDLDKQLQEILVELNHKVPTQFMGDYDKAKAQLKTLVAEQVVAGQIAELERIDGFAYGTDYGEYQADRIQVLRSKNESS